MLSVVQLFQERACESKGWSTLLEVEHSVGMLFVSLQLAEQRLEPGFPRVAAEQQSCHLSVLGVPPFILLLSSVPVRIPIFRNFTTKRLDFTKLKYFQLKIVKLVNPDQYNYVMENTYTLWQEWHHSLLDSLVFLYAT